ncbi:YjbF family lipoprotein [Epibacterium ulvae]|uniref:YjbF family lipoprotein n=1 Tax=Epibacterium ulvae TaxID=1156985 RepID=UPI001BFC1279|nr:YjbF family lipoprotein [Epibacterium ulvae]MBT8154493.1 YjbF family lipoprotein [Epibacterium ulvae]
MIKQTRLMGALVGLALLAACAKGPERTPLEVEIFSTIREQIALRRAPKQERPPLTRALLDTLGSPYIEVTLEANGIFAYLQPQLVRRDDGPGEVVHWVTEDQVSVTLRDGILIATRGLRGDLLSASTLAQSGGPQGPEGRGARLFDLRFGDHESKTLEMACTVADLGAEPLEIVEITYATHHLQETCEGANGRIVNDFWVDSRTGRVWQSRQWAGPLNGYIRIRQLTL